MKRYQQYLLILLLVFSLVINASARGFYKLGDNHVYEVYQRIDLINYGGKAKNVVVKIPVFDLEELPPYQQLISLKTNPVNLKSLMRKDQSVITIDQIDGGKTVTLELAYCFSNYTIEHDLRNYFNSTNNKNIYLRPEPEIESDAPQIIALANKIVAGERLPVERAKKIFEYVSDYLEYRIVEGTSRSALATLERGYGSCVDFSLLYIALCRAVDIPARFVSGYRFDSKDISGRETNLEPFGHAWVEINLPVIGWITVDPTYLYTYNGEKQVNYDFFGKILNQDRHLFMSYSQEPKSSVNWQYLTNSPAKVEMRTKLTIRRIR